MDTEFPGIVIHHTGDLQDVADTNYQYVRANVDRLHLLQLGLTFFNAAGSLPASPDSGRPVVWQSAFDFGYLLKILTSKPLPETREGFLELLHKFIPLLYDIKRVIHLNDNFHGGLNSVATSLGVERVGIAHQAGSDSFVTAQVFLKLRGHRFGTGSVEDYVGLVFGLDAETAQIFSNKSRKEEGFPATSSSRYRS
ncbi:CCR4-associated factor 1 [Musa troglodytarum]|uniref:CCR4-associated factor 1 n=1 Tax=Musa troglodytarum TaxID=320322 RepID=A0A9E7KQB1_9LILI|nr:CCR4-associated factor 1 [Musa troglodytarum]